MNRLKALRISKGLSQLSLAGKSGISQPAIFSIEAGATKRPRISTITKLAGALGVDPADILNENDKD